MLFLAVVGAFSLSASLSRAEVPPPPFTPVRATTQEFRTLGRKTELGAFLLPSQITAAGKSLLEAPIRLVSEPDVFSKIAGVTCVLKNHGDRADWRWNGTSADFSFNARMFAECDGFCWYEIELKPKRVIKLSSLRLEIPRLASTARYLHTASYDWSNVSQGLPELGGKWSDKFTPYVWLGDEERGLAWFAESDEGFRLREPAGALNVKTKGDSVILTVKVIDREETISSPIKLRFGLQASPVKPVSFAWRAKTRILHDIHYESCVPVRTENVNSIG